MISGFRYVVEEGGLVRRPWRVPSPKQGEVVVKVAGAGLNRADILQVMGRYPPPPGWPNVPGLEMGGEVVAVGAEVRRWRPGDRVMGLIAAGAFASHVVIDARHLWPVPGILSSRHAAAIPEALCTAYLNIVGRGAFRPSHRVLIHSAAGGVGSTAVQLVHFLGGRAIGMVGSHEKVGFVKRLGAEMVLDRRLPLPQLEETLRLHFPEGVDIVLDTVGAGWEAFHVDVLRRGGRWLIIGLLNRPSHAGAFPWAQFLQKELILRGTLLRNKSADFKAHLMRTIEEVVLPAYAEGRLRPIIDRIVPMDHWAEAFEWMRRGEVKGKVVLIPPSPIE